MEALFHLIFVIIKIAILGSVYALLILLIFKLIGHFKPNSWFDHITQRKLQFWFICFSTISVGLFAFMFTHFGDHGLGDSSRIPIPHFRDIQEVNGTETYIQDIKNGLYALDIEDFIIAQDFVYGEISAHNENHSGNYFIYDLKKNEVKTHATKLDFYKELMKLGLDEDADFKNFSYYYKKYWNGWRFWLLP